MTAPRRLDVAILALFLSSCTVFHPWASKQHLNGSYDQAFQATLETLEARGFPLKRVNRNEGIIETGRRPVGGGRPHRRVETVRAEIEDEGGGEASVRLMMTFLKPPPASAPLDDRGQRSPEAAPIDRSVVYDDYLDAIAKRIQCLENTILPNKN